MAELKLFKINGTVEELKSKSVTIEKELQRIIERNMQDFFAVRFLASEYRIDNGRMDSIGIDENNCPVIFEYKRSSSENVINQGLFYLNWLLEHKANFKLLVLEAYGNAVANDIDWSMPRVICIASDFNKYDEEAIKQINRNVSLIRYAPGLLPFITAKRVRSDLSIDTYANIPLSLFGTPQHRQRQLQKSTPRHNRQY